MVSRVFSWPTGHTVSDSESSEQERYFSARKHVPQVTKTAETQTTARSSLEKPPNDQALQHARASQGFQQRASPRADKHRRLQSYCLTADAGTKPVRARTSVISFTPMAGSWKRRRAHSHVGFTAAQPFWADEVATNMTPFTMTSVHEVCYALNPY